MAGPIEFFGDAVGNVGKFVGGIGEHIGTGLTAVRDAERAKLAAPQKKIDAMQSLIDSRFNMDILRKARAEKLTQDDADLEKAGKLALAEQRLRKSGATVAADAALAKINQEAGVEKETQEVALSDYFKDSLGPLEDKEFGRASKKATNDFAKDFAKEAQRLGMDASNAELLFGQLYEKEVSKAGFWTDDVLPVKRDVKDNRSYFSYELPGKAKAATGAAAATKKVTPAFDDLTQGATPDFPEDNVPKTFDQLGITDVGDQEQLQELDDAMPEMDVRADIVRDPQFYQSLLKALRDGKIDIKKAIEIMQSQ